MMKAWFTNNTATVAVAAANAPAHARVARVAAMATNPYRISLFAPPRPAWSFCSTTLWEKSSRGGIKYNPRNAD